MSVFRDKILSFTSHCGGLKPHPHLGIRTVNSKAFCHKMNLQGEEPVFELYFLGKEISSYCRFVLIAELLIHISKE